MTSFHQSTVILWVTDGTAQGTKRVANIGSDYSIMVAAGAIGPQVEVVGRYVYLLVMDQGTDDTALYRSDGTAKGTVRLHNFPSASFLTGNLQFAAALPNGTVALSVVAGGTASKSLLSQFWVSDGTVAGTKPLKLGNVDVEGITALGGRFFFNGTDPKHGTALWQSDGTATGTSLVQEILLNANPSALAELNGKLIVSADDDVYGIELMSGPIPKGPQP